MRRTPGTARLLRAATPRPVGWWNALMLPDLKSLPIEYQSM